MKRYGIAKLSNVSNGKALYVVLLGHDDETKIFMPFDIRDQLGVEKGGSIDFCVARASFWGKLCWYVGSPDPAISLPAWIAIVGIGLALIAFVLPFVVS